MASTFAAQVFFPRAAIRLFREGIFVLVSEMETKHVRVARAVCTIKVAGVTRLLEGPSPAQEPSLGGHPPPLAGTGKTHTMLGMDTEPGIYLQTLSDLFQAIEETRDSTDCSVSMSYLEIYNEVIRDLLSPSSGFLDLREDSRGSIQIAGITEVATSNAQEVRVTGPTEGHVAPPRQPRSPVTQTGDTQLQGGF
ncbi:kinesin-like protein KIF19 [Bos taurus]|uniref:kinesin-like protein KIF19 n=1 Tax=Bos taurus TaxID=9913 RepID=UPI0028CB5F7F|nr:kinesin-like protein KIF19 [Bos taurus]